jgi:hypothetical protein
MMMTSLAESRRQHWLWLTGAPKRLFRSERASDASLTEDSRETRARLGA